LKELKITKRMVALLSVICLVTSVLPTVSIYGVGDAQNAGDIIVSEYEIAEEFEVITADNETKEILVDSELVNAVSEDSIEKLVEINPEAEQIELKTMDNFLESEAIPEQVAILTDDNMLVNVNINDEILEKVEPQDILDIIEENDLDNFSTVTINDIESIEYDDDVLYSMEEVSDFSEGEILFDSEEELVEAVDEAIEELEVVGDEAVENSVIGIETQWKASDIMRTTTTLRNYGSQYVWKDVFIASAARGETYTLTKKFSTSVTLSLTGGAVFSGVSAKSGLKTSVSYSVAKSYKYSGPKAPYNSREYRVKLYAGNCYVEQLVRGYPSKNLRKYYATYRVPVKYASYSIDKKIK